MKPLSAAITNRPWKQWLRRTYEPFVLGLILEGGTSHALRSIPVGSTVGQDWGVYQKDSWYLDHDAMARSAEKFGRKYNATDVLTMISSCESYYHHAQKVIDALNTSKEDPLKRLAEFHTLMCPVAAYIWITHVVEQWFDPIIKKKMAQAFPDEDPMLVIARYSTPSKKGLHEQMMEQLHSDAPLSAVKREFGWIKSRTGFGAEYSIKEIKRLRDDDTPKEAQAEIIPETVREEVALLKELVYFRLFRTDIFFALLSRAKPLFKDAAKKLNVESVKDYLCTDLLEGRCRKVSPPLAMAVINDRVVAIAPFIEEEGYAADLVRGTAANPGTATGKVRIVFKDRDVALVKTGDILVTNMTIPGFLPAMKKAAAFVTDEGGITCHAAILAREMQKPCIIGTRNATKVFKNGDIVEVDAVKGIARKIP